MAGFSGAVTVRHSHFSQVRQFDIHRTFAFPINVHTSVTRCQVNPTLPQPGGPRPSLVRPKGGTWRT